MKWYSIDRIKEAGCDYNFIVSGRGPGKSTAVVNMLIDAYFNDLSEYGRPAQFARIVRYDWAISRTMMKGWFNEVNKEHLSMYGYAETYKGGEWRIHSLDSDDQPDEAPYQTMGYILPLNAQDEYKSGVDFSNVTNVVFEEFVQLRERDYVESEVELFLSAMSTIVRNRQNVRCWFIGNTLTKYNPYFELFGIDVDRIGLQPGDLKTFRTSGFEGLGATVAIEYAQMSHEDIQEIAPLMRIGGNITATSGLYAVDPSVTEYHKRTATLLDSDMQDALPCAGAYLGGGKFARIRITTTAQRDNMRLLVVSLYTPTMQELQHATYLNLSGEVNPTYTVLDITCTLKCMSPLSVYANQRTLRLLQQADASCQHAYETDECKYKWRNFVDAYGYDRGEA